MKAIVYTQYGQPDAVLQLKEVETPAPGDGEVLVKVHAAGINYADWAFVRGEPFMVRLMGAGLSKPQNTILGSDIAGRVEAVGPNVRQYQPGDEVFGDIADRGFGGFAEYVAVPEKVLAPKPSNLPFDEAAAVPQAAVVALQGLRKGQIQSGQKVLVYGASGGIGTFAVQIAKSFGTEVTGVCSTRNVELVRSIGADHVIDYTQEDFTQNEQAYDLILATAGYRSLSDYRRALSPTGICIVTGGSMEQIFQSMLVGPWVSMAGNQKIANLAAKASQEDLTFVKELIEAGKVKPVIDRCFPLSDAAGALLHYGEGHTRGKVVVTVTEEGA